MSFQLEKTVIATSNASDIRDDYKLANAGDVTATLTAQHVLTGILYSTPAVGIVLTLPDASAMVVADSKKDKNAGLHFWLRNDGISTITVAAGTGGTLTGSDTITSTSNSHWYLYYTNVSSGTEAYQVTRLG